jgi:CHAD domain-containing protein
MDMITIKIKETLMFLKTIDVENKKYVQIDTLIKYFDIIKKNLTDLHDMALLVDKMEDMFKSINDNKFPEWLNKLYKE